MGKFTLLPEEAEAPSGKYELMPEDDGAGPYKGMAGSVMISADPQRSATAGTILGSSFIDKPEVKMAYFAAKRFPNLSPEEAISRYGVGSDGNVFYRADDGQMYYEVPHGQWDLASVGKRMLSATGDAIQATPPAVVGVATAPAMLAGPPGVGFSMAATGAAGAAGEGIRQGIGNVVAGDPVSMSQVAKSAALDATTQGVGSAVAKFAERRAVSDLKRLNPAQVSDINRKAQSAGIPLTPAEQTNLPSLKFRQQLVSEMPGGGADVMDDFYRRRGEKVQSAMDRYLATLSGQDSPELAALSAKGASLEAIESYVKQRKDAAGPLYEQAYRDFKGLPAQYKKEADQLMKRPSMQQAAQRAARIAADDGVNLKNPRNSLQGMHYMQMALRDMAGEADSGLKGTEARAIRGLRDRLLTIMDFASPTDAAGNSLYQKARELYAYNSPAVEFAKSAKMSLIGFVANMGDRNATKALDALMGPNTGPLAMSQFKTAIMRVDPSAWQGVKRAYIQSAWADATKRYATGQPAMQPAKFASEMMSPKQRQALQEALTPAEFQAFNDLMDVFERTGVGLPRNSTTVPKAMEAARMEAEAGGLTGNAARIFRLPGRVASGSIADKWGELRMGAYGEKIAEIITSPDAMQKLKELKKLSPNDKRFIAGASQLIGGAVNTQVSTDPSASPKMPAAR